MKHPNQLNGFTLLELMVVIAIISIIASVSAPSFIRHISKAKLVEAQNIASQHQSLIEEYILLNGAFPSADTFNAVKTSPHSDSIVKSIAVSDISKQTGSLTLTLNTTTGISSGNTFTFKRGADHRWQCQSTLAANLLPDQCQEVAE
ncbi:pilin [Marinomonas epiphytica]